MKPLESRKRLLVAESEINRAQLQEEWQTMSDGVRSIAGRARSFSAIASSVAMLAAGLAAFRWGKPVDAGAKPSWLQTILKGAGLISSLWLAFRSRGRDQNDK